MSATSTAGTPGTPAPGATRRPSVGLDDPRLKDRSTSRTYAALALIVALLAVLPCSSTSRPRPWPSAP